MLSKSVLSFGHVSNKFGPTCTEAINKAISIQRDVIMERRSEIDTHNAIKLNEFTMIHQEKNALLTCTLSNACLFIVHVYAVILFVYTRSSSPATRMLLQRSRRNLFSWCSVYCSITLHTEPSFDKNCCKKWLDLNIFYFIYIKGIGQSTDAML